MQNSVDMSPSAEDYLEMVYSLYLRNGTIRMTDIASELGVSKPSVNRAIKTLKGQGLVQQELYGEINLTEKGIHLAKNVMHRHKLIKHFLVDILGVSNEVADKEACHLEHYMSQDTINKFEDFISKYDSQKKSD
ncbi:MAG: metal-dependent transcriptional regulator [Eubacteriales bacterium]|jgi:Mn-dependent DtxR family transcriptional regulator|nr:metal-dependent transcriptional regulator [Eubacteriales bacterium]